MLQPNLYAILQQVQYDKQETKSQNTILKIRSFDKLRMTKR